MRRIPLLTLLVLALATPAFAGPQDDVAAIVKGAVESAEPTTAVFQGFASLPDLELDGKGVAAALASGGAPQGGVVAQILGNLLSVKKSGDVVEMHRAAAITIPIVVNGETKGYVGLAKDVSFRITKQGATIQVDNTNGTSVGTAADSLHDMKSLTFTKEGNTPVITLTAGWLFITQTKRFVLPAAPAPPPPVAAKPAAAAPAADPAGLPLPAPPKAKPLVPASTPAGGATTEPSPGAPPETPGIAQKLAG